ncbi:hypothetical protein, partial [Bacillus anthracis]|uniref:hypothetical protein n=1 Tax=Bacillus anthracis TaxID=1392 RepID=UPI001E42F2FD
KCIDSLTSYFLLIDLEYSPYIVINYINYIPKLPLLSFPTEEYFWQLLSLSIYLPRSCGPYQFQSYYLFTVLTFAH